MVEYGYGKQLQAKLARSDAASLCGFQQGGEIRKRNIHATHRIHNFHIFKFGFLLLQFPQFGLKFADFFFGLINFFDYTLNFYVQNIPPFLLIQSPKGVKVFCPIPAIGGSVADRVAAMNHHTISHIQTNMGYWPGAVIGGVEENQIPRLCFSRWNGSTMIEKTGCCCTPYAANTGFIDDPTHKARAIKGR